MIEDARGLTLSTQSAEAASLYNDALASYLDYKMVAGKQLKAAIETDGEFLMAEYLRGCFLLMLETNALLGRVNKSADALLKRSSAATSREQQHFVALSAWAKGDFDNACRTWERILYANPHDLLALKLHHYLTFWTGRPHVLRSAVESVLATWSDTTPGFSYVLGMYAFALEESGDYTQAEHFARRAVELNGDDLWAIHALAHVLEMQGRVQEGIALIDRPLQDWADRNPFQGHVWWHGALFLLATGDHERTLEYYDKRLTVANTEHFMDVQNMASLLKRLELLGVDPGHRWEALAEHAAGRTDDHLLPFNSVHLCLALAAGGDRQACAAQLDSMRDFADTPNNYAASTMTSTTIPLCEALIAFEDGDHVRACDTLWPIRHDLAPIGGSHAQRDLFAQILLQAALKSGREDMAAGLLRERTTRKPNAKHDWQTYAKTLERLGDKRGAERATQVVQAL